MPSSTQSSLFSGKKKDSRLVEARWLTVQNDMDIENACLHISSLSLGGSKHLFKSPIPLEGQEVVAVQVMVCVYARDPEMLR